MTIPPLTVLIVLALGLTALGQDDPRRARRFGGS